MTLYTIAPTDLTFLYHECKRCFYNKVKGVWKRPYTPFPSIFKKIDSCMATCYAGINPNEIDPSLPSGKMTTEKRRITSSPISVGHQGHQIVFRGEPDAVALFDDHTIGVFDFKTSDTKTEHLDVYRPQLYAGRDMLLFPKEEGSTPLATSHMGLICASPTSMTFSGAGTALFEMNLTYKSIAIDEEWWAHFLEEVIAVLEDAEPESKDCFYCEVQKAVHLK